MRNEKTRRPHFGGRVRKSAKNPEKKAGILDTHVTEWGELEDGRLDGDDKDEPKISPVLGSGKYMRMVIKTRRAGSMNSSLSMHESCENRDDAQRVGNCETVGCGDGKRWGLGGGRGRGRRRRCKVQGVGDSAVSAANPSVNVTST